MSSPHPKPGECRVPCRTKGVRRWLVHYYRQRERRLRGEKIHLLPWGPDLFRAEPDRKRLGAAATRGERLPFTESDLYGEAHRIRLDGDVLVVSPGYDPERTPWVVGFLRAVDGPLHTLEHRGVPTLPILALVYESREQHRGFAYAHDRQQRYAEQWREARVAVTKAQARLSRLPWPLGGGLVRSARFDAILNALDADHVQPEPVPPRGDGPPASRLALRDFAIWWIGCWNRRHSGKPVWKAVAAIVSAAWPQDRIDGYAADPTYLARTTSIDVGRKIRADEQGRSQDDGADILAGALGGTGFVVESPWTSLVGTTGFSGDSD